MSNRLAVEKHFIHPMIPIAWKILLHPKKGLVEVIAKQGNAESIRDSLRFFGANFDSSDKVIEECIDIAKNEKEGIVARGREDTTIHEQFGEFEEKANRYMEFRRVRAVPSALEFFGVNKDLSDD